MKEDPISPQPAVPSPGPRILLTFDHEWAPDFVVESVVGELIARRIPSTWFITHRTPILDLLRAHADLFELGIHPNFLPGSTQGSTPEEVLKDCMRTVPEASCVRTHSQVQSTPLLATLLSSTPIRTDVTPFLPRCPGLRPFPFEWKGTRLWRVPYYWEDDYEFHAPRPSWTARQFTDAPAGLKVLNFHPLAVYLNLNDARRYEDLKRGVRSLSSARPGDFDPFRCAGPGPASLFSDLVSLLAGPDRTSCVRDLVRALPGGS